MKRPLCAPLEAQRAGRPVQTDGKSITGLHQPRSKQKCVLDLVKATHAAKGTGLRFLPGWLPSPICPGARMPRPPPFLPLSVLPGLFQNFLLPHLPLEEGPEVWGQMWG